ncbi:uncharacterized protein LOC142771296 [Rhipicephalus microplus]|uniref:uncharacterized protein LOC142771296 n=1 Tax=Rhipicephalus microplus TaxID=6941 RepID=UPI003F6AF875
MKETTSSSFGASRAPGFQDGRLWTSMWDHVPPPGPLFASLLNTREDSGRMACRASREHSVPTAAEQCISPKKGRVNFQAGTGHPDQTSRTDSVSQDQMSTRSSPTTSVTSSMASSGVASATSAKMALSGDRRRALPSGTARQSHSLPLQGVSKDTDTKELSEPKRKSSLVLTLMACVLVLMVALFLLLFILSNGPVAQEHPQAGTNQSTEVSRSTPKSTVHSTPSRPAPGLVGSACNNSSSCLGEAVCLDGVCRCEGSDLDVVEGICVAVSTPETQQPFSTRTTVTSTTSSTRTSELRTGETVPTAKRFTFVRTVRLATATRAAATKNPSVTARENPVVDTTEVAADGQGSVAVVSYATAKEEEVEEMRRHRGQQA